MEGEVDVLQELKSLRHTQELIFFFQNIGQKLSNIFFQIRIDLIILKYTVIHIIKLTIKHYVNI